MSRLMASRPRITTCVSSPIQYELSTRGPMRKARARTAETALRPSIQSRRPERQHQDHRRKQREVRQLGHERLAEIVDHADDDAADERAFEAAHAADDHHDER